MANAIRVTEIIGEISVQKKLIEDASAQQKNNIEIKAALAYNLLERREYAVCVEEYGKLCKEDSNNANHWLNLTAAMRGLKKTNRAIATVKRSYVLHPQKREIKHTLVQLTETGKHDAAKRAIQMVLEDIDMNENNEIYNIEFIGEGYKLVDSRKLLNIAREWEKASSRQHS